MRIKLTTKTIENLRPGPVRREIADAITPGLYLILQPSGVKSWAVRYRHVGRPRKYTLPGKPDLKTARAVAAQVLRDVAAGQDPARTKREARTVQPDSIERVIEEFLDRHVRRNCGPRTIAERERQFRNHVLPRWRGRLVSEIIRRDVVRLLDEVVDVGPVAANRLRSTLTTLFGWCVARDIIASSPMTGVKAPSIEQSRERVLSDGELVAVWRAAEQIGFPFGDAVRLLILTGQRRSEVIGMAWSEIDLGASLWRLPAHRVKNRREHIVPIGEAVRALLVALPRVHTPNVFTGGASGTLDCGAGKRQLDARLSPEMPHWTLHDVRRSVASGMARLGINLPVIEKVLNHASGSFAGIVGVYQRHNFVDEKRQALDAWGAHVERLVSGKRAAVVVSLARGA